MKNFSLSVFGLFLGILSAADAALPTMSVVMDKPKEKAEWTRSGRNPRDRKPIVITCQEYADFAVYQENDPEHKGATEISVRLPARKGTRPSLCQKTFSGKKLKLPIGEVYLGGARGRFVFAEGADTFGSEMPFQVFDAFTGRKIYEDVRDVNQEFLVRTDRSTADHTVTSLQYFKVFRVDCGIAVEKKKEDCWSQFLAKLAIPAEVMMDVPTCGPDYQKANSPLENPALVGLRVAVPELEKPVMEYVGRRTSCVPAP